MNIVIVVPTIRPDVLNATFIPAWQAQINRYQARLLVVLDGDEPQVTEISNPKCNFKRKDLPKTERGLIFDHTDAVRNLGFLYVARYLPETDIILTLDDDVKPHADTIGDHVKALSSKVPISWMPVGDHYTRGFPYAVREEADVWVSHGVWNGIHDYDAPSQLVKGNPPMQFYRGVIPKGTLAPICGMNLAFRMEALPLVYYAPMGKKIGYERFADIWMGIELKRDLDMRDKALVTGYSAVWHNRQSNVFQNLIAESKGLAANETYWKAPSPYRERHLLLRKRWLYVHQHKHG